MANDIEKTVKRTVKKDVKKTVKKNKGGAIAVLLAFIVFAAAGFLTAMLMTKNDGLTLNDTNKTAELKIGGVYTEQNAKFTLWGKDASDLVKIEIFDGDGEKAEKVDTSAAGEYFVVYSINTEAASGFLDKLVIGKYKNYKQVRQITVEE